MQHHAYPSIYLLREMPRNVLFGKAADIEEWCKVNEKQVPNLLDLATARTQVRNNKSRNNRKGKK